VWVRVLEYLRDSFVNALSKTRQHTKASDDLTIVEKKAIKTGRDRALRGTWPIFVSLQMVPPPVLLERFHRDIAPARTHGMFAHPGTKGTRV